MYGGREKGLCSWRKLKNSHSKYLHNWFITRKVIIYYISLKALREPNETGTWVIRKIIKAYTFNKSQSITAVIKISSGFFLLPPHIDLLYAIEKIDSIVNHHYHDILNPHSLTHSLFFVNLGRIADSGIFKLRRRKINKLRLIPSKTTLGVSTWQHWRENEPLNEYIGQAAH